MKTESLSATNGQAEKTRMAVPSRSPASSPSLFYALDLNPRVLFELRRSINSVRRHAPAMPIYALIAGEPSADDRKYLDSVGVNVIPTRIERGTSPIFLKWRALMQLPPQAEWLYLDTDTLIFDDLKRLFDLSGPQDFLARFEIGCGHDETTYPFLVNAMLLAKSHVDHWMYQRIAERLGSRFVPIFNNGVMMFRNGFAQRLGKYWDDFLRLERSFRRKRLPYPCWNPHILDELVSPLVFGTMDGFTWGELPPQLCPFYVEYRGRHAETPGILLHTWTPFYGGCLFEFLGKDDALAYLALRAKDPGGDLVSGFRAKLRSRWITMGSYWMRLPKSVQETWLRLGSAGLQPVGSSEKGERDAGAERIRQNN